MKLSRVVFVVVTAAAAIVACSSSGSSKSPDAPASGDAPAACTGKLYDACNAAMPNCMAHLMCKDFSGSGFSACTQGCSSTNPCPMQDGQAVPCNNMGICKPLGANTNCTAP